MRLDVSSRARWAYKFHHFSDSDDFRDSARLQRYANARRSDKFRLPSKKDNPPMKKLINSVLLGAIVLSSNSSYVAHAAAAKKPTRVTTGTLTITLPKGAMFSGNAQVEIDGISYVASRTRTSLTVRGVPAGTRFVSVLEPSDDMASYTTATVRAGKVTTVSAVFKTGGTVAATSTAPIGTKFTVNPMTRSKTSNELVKTNAILTASVDKEGDLTLPSLPPGKYAVDPVDPKLAKTASSVVDVTASQAGDDTIEIDLTTDDNAQGNDPLNYEVPKPQRGKAALGGVVSWSTNIFGVNSKLLAGATIALFEDPVNPFQPTGTLDSFLSPYIDSSKVNYSNLIARTVSDSNGRYSFDNLDPRKCYLLIAGEWDSTRNRFSKTYYLCRKGIFSIDTINLNNDNRWRQDVYLQVNDGWSDIAYRVPSESYTQVKQKVVSPKLFISFTRLGASADPSVSFIENPLYAKFVDSLSTPSTSVFDILDFNEINLRIAPGDYTVKIFGNLISPVTYQINVPETKQYNRIVVDDLEPVNP